jgi:hypothetical protein
MAHFVALFASELTDRLLLVVRTVVLEPKRRLLHFNGRSFNSYQDHLNGLIAPNT